MKDLRLKSSLCQSLCVQTFAGKLLCGNSLFWMCVEGFVAKASVYEKSSVKALHYTVYKNLLHKSVCVCISSEKMQKEHVLWSLTRGHGCFKSLIWILCAKSTRLPLWIFQPIFTIEAWSEAGDLLLTLVKGCCQLAVSSCPTAVIQI